MVKIKKKSRSNKVIKKSHTTESIQRDNVIDRASVAFPLWFWIVLILGFFFRIYLVVFTEGTYDVRIWQHHASGVTNIGLIGYYHANPEMNHPPFISMCLSWLLHFSLFTGIPFRILLRAPFAAFDIGTTLLLLNAYRTSRFRLVIAACYWLYPLTMIYSAYHGNTDSAIAFFLVLCCLLLSRSEPLWTAAALGVSLWMKLPSILALPVFFFVIRRWQTRLLFLLIVGLVGISTYIPALLLDPNIVIRNVFGYQGQLIQTISGLPVWGAARILLSYLQGSPSQWQQLLFQSLLFYLKNNLWFCLVPILLFSFLRRSHNTFPGITLTLFGVYSILYGFSNYWSFQYFAWSLPFWFCVPLLFALPSTLIAGLYIYGLYWLLCGNPFLYGLWDFTGHLYWPVTIIFFRDLCAFFFFIISCILLVASIKSLPLLPKNDT